MGRRLPLGIMLLIMSVALPAAMADHPAMSSTAHDGDRVTQIRDSRHVHLIIDQGGQTTIDIVVFNNGTQNRDVAVSFAASGPNGSFASPAGPTLEVQAGSNVIYPYPLAILAETPVGRYNTTFTVKWDDGLVQTLHGDVSVEPPFLGVKFYPVSAVVYNGTNGARVIVEVSAVNATRSARFELSHEKAIESWTVYGLGTISSVPRGGRQTATIDLWPGLPPSANGQRELRLTLELLDYPTVAKRTISVPMDVRVEPEAVSMDLDPPVARVLPGGDATFAVNITDLTGRGVIARGGGLQITLSAPETASASDGLVPPPVVEYDGRGKTLDPGGTLRFDVHVRSNATTLPGEYPISIRFLSYNTGETLAEGNVTFEVGPAAVAQIVARAEPVASRPNATAIVRVQLLNVGTAAAEVELDADAGVNLSATRLRLEPGAGAAVEASVAVPPDAEVGARLQKTLRIHAPASQGIALVVDVVDLPPATVGNPSAPSLDSIAQMAAERPVVAGSLAVAGAGLVALAVSRRESWRLAAAAAALPLYTRLARPELLADERRGEIHARIAAMPGITLTELSREAGVGVGALVHHLRMLERHGFLTSRRDGRFRRFYVAGGAPAVAPSVSGGVQGQILGLLAAGPLTRPEIGNHLALSQQGVSYHVKGLERAGRVVIRRVDGKDRVHRVYDFVVEGPGLLGDSAARR